MIPKTQLFLVSFPYMGMIPKKIVYWVLGMGISIIPIPNSQKSSGVGMIPISNTHNFWVPNTILGLGIGYGYILKPNNQTQIFLRVNFFMARIKRKNNSYKSPFLDKLKSNLVSLFLNHSLFLMKKI